MKLSQYHIYIILFTLIALGYVAYIFVITIKNPTISEHFTSDSEYASRLEVIKVFDGYLHRNPSVDEIKKYSSFINEHDILTNVMKDYKLPELLTKEKPNESESLVDHEKVITDSLKDAKDVTEKEDTINKDTTSYTGDIRDIKDIKDIRDIKDTEDTEDIKEIESFDSSGIKGIGVGTFPKKTVKTHIESVNKAIESISNSMKEISQIIDETL